MRLITEESLQASFLQKHLISLENSLTLKTRLEVPHIAQKFCIYAR